LKRLGPLVQQAELLAAQYDAVVANPPYMTSDYFPASLKNWVKAVFAVRRTDLYALFIERALRGSSGGDRIAIISRDSWMFLPTYEVLREQIVLNHTILSMAHLGSGAFESIGGQVVRATVFSLHASGMPGYQSSFFNLVGGDHLEKEAAFLRREHRIELVQERLSAIPGCPMAFDASDALRNCFAGNTPIGEVAELREGIHTGHNDRFMRYWWEVSLGDFSRNESSTDSIDAHGKKWIPYNKGGEQRKWYGNNDYVIAFDRHSRDAMASLSGHVRPSQHLYFLEGGTWSAWRTWMPTPTNDSWDFQSLPILGFPIPSPGGLLRANPTLESSYTAWIAQNRDTIAEMKRLEEENNRLFIDAYGLQDELTPDVPIEQITLTVNPAYRYGGKLTEEEQWTRFRAGHHEGTGLLRRRLHDGPLQPGRTGPHLRPQRERGIRPR
jgi:hypothetical protein